MANTHVTDMHVDEPGAPSMPDVAPSLPRKTVGYVWDKLMLNHACVFDDGEDEDDGRHPEQPQRLISIYKELDQAGCLRRMQQLRIRPVTMEEAMLVHSVPHWDKIMRIKGRHDG
jgi:histone deacetylase 6